MDGVPGLGATTGSEPRVPEGGRKEMWVGVGAKEVNCKRRLLHWSGVGVGVGIRSNLKRHLQFASRRTGFLRDGEMRYGSPCDEVVWCGVVQGGVVWG